MAKTIAIDKLKPGMVIIKITAQNGPVKIRKSGLVSSADMVNALREMGVLEVEIDPEITVEMKQPKITKSKTLQLLENNKTLTHDVENNISEQFNRNLFLPSVQELPEAWQYYGKKLAVIFVVILGGFGSGWSISQYPVWMQVFSANTQSVEVAAIETVEQTQMQQVDSQGPENTALDEAAQQSDSQGPENTALNEAAQQSDSPATQQTVRIGASALEQSTDVDASLAIIDPAVGSEPQANISPELLKRFQDAVASLDIEETNNGDSGASDGKYNSDYTNEIVSSITPIHKLPARVLTRLPSMAFSTHMYASDPQERWVRVNGKRIVEGQQIERGLMLIGIEPQHVILNFEGQEFRMDALTDW